MPYIAKFYKIVNTINDDIYFGSTKNHLRIRFQGHKKDCKNKNHKQNLLYKLATEYGWEHFRIVLIEHREVKDKEDQLRVEQEFIDNLKPQLNKCNAYGINLENLKFIKKKCQDEYYAKHQDELIEYQKQYREEHKDMLIEYRKEYYAKTRERQLQGKKEK